ncbi:hypothetical protein AGABI1DRAFT_126579 [Agaricus bisporus var. burnettii JB137-S8]|uniref:F-box domain-containing protein n=1 Tax=Agaricus bisporus var. burnettii (strain JB137-S8 / ATCC MYA-4627 / FGSC 10392) TaxID=597362 RepID=K5XFR1_AGABU|nr:uncharacterized protein AGABI1DRAFT_126579 [Agaricus bisporus var. burnettii JB137-S8]EKM82248.1 hypothetical protein AGABI1DRAFT_126579 [Agaricus bisporus var. burnettii JB137-S8]
MSVVQLPYELWYHIAAYLTLYDMERTKLYALNRPFLTLYLREQYKILRLVFSCGSYFTNADPITLSKTLSHLHSLIAENVRTLNVVLEQHSFIPKYNLPTKKLLRVLLKKLLLKRRIHKLRKNFPSFPQIHGTFSELKNLTSINCALLTECPPFVFNSQRFLTSGISAAWTSSRNTLTCLVLTIHIYPLNDLGLDAITFPHLQQFHLILRSKLRVVVNGEIDSTPSESLTIPAPSMAQFLARHQYTLKTLTLAFPINAQKFAAVLLNQFPVLPSLSNLQLHFTPDGIIRNPSLPLGLFKTLESNSKSIKGLSLVFRGLSGCDFLREEDSQLYRDWWTAQSFERIQFPKLERLQLDFYEVINDAPLMLQFAVSSTANSLHLESDIIPSNIERLSTLYANLEQNCHIETLSLSMRTLTPSVLSCLAHGFSNIKTLKLRYTGIGLDDRNYDPAMFLQEISQTRFPNWSLENIYFFSRWVEHRDHQLFKKAISDRLRVPRTDVERL